MARNREARSRTLDVMSASARKTAAALSWLQPVKNFMPNGLHAILLAKGPVVRLDMYRFETSYDLLITSHTLVSDEDKPKPKLETKMIFFHRFGILERELWGKDKMFRGAVAPQFFMSNGSEARVPHVYQQAVLQDDGGGDLHEMQAPASAGATLNGNVSGRAGERKGVGSGGVSDARRLGPSRLG